MWPWDGKRFLRTTTKERLISWISAKLRTVVYQKDTIKKVIKGRIF